jgi:hypothetical protein
MITQVTHSDVQAVRRVYENENTINTTTSAKVIYIACRPDASSGEDIILWDDILAVFSTTPYIHSGDFAFPFLKGPDYKKYSLANNLIYYTRFSLGRSVKIAKWNCCLGGGAPDTLEA